MTRVPGVLSDLAAGLNDDAASKVVALRWAGGVHPDRPRPGLADEPVSDLSSYYDELRGRLQALLNLVEDELPQVTVDLVEELIGADEFGVALEIMSEMLVESRGLVTQETLSMFSQLVQVMRLEPVNVERLRPMLSPSNGPGRRDRSR